MSNKNNRKKILHRINLLLLPWIPNGLKTIPYATVLAGLAYIIERRFSQLNVKSSVDNVTGRNHIFPYFWNVAETYNSMSPLCLRLTETWKFNLRDSVTFPSNLSQQISAVVRFRHVSANGFPCSTSATSTKTTSTSTCYIYQNTNARWFFEQQRILTFNPVGDELRLQP